MAFLRQIKFEIINILMSKFLLIIGILVLLAGIAVPLLGLATQANQNPIDGPVRPYVTKDIGIGKPIYPGDGGQDAITIDGITITSDNPFYWNISYLISEKQMVENDKNRFTYPATIDLVLQMIDAELQYYLRFAARITRYQDYRMDLAWRGMDQVYELFFLQQQGVAEAVLFEAAGYRKGLDPDTIRNKYIQITSEQRLAAIDAASESLAMLYAIVENNDFPKYIAMRIKMERDQIASLEENIALQVQLIISNPSQEEYINQIIENMRQQIRVIETSNIPLLQFRLERNIIPGEAIWQNTALSDIENSRNQLVYLVIVSEEEYNKNLGPRDDKYYGYGYTSYQEYVKMMQRQIDQHNKTIIIAQKSLDTNRPDMKYVPDGSRNRTILYLEYGLIVALYGVLIGGWLIASEYQQGTIRLLMIRPKTRTKILLAKFVAALAVCLAVDLAGSLLNAITNGICYGFTDFAFPNYTITGQVNFLAYYVPRLLACVVPIVFLFTIAFMLSVLIKNIAVSIALPIVLFVGSVIIMNLFAYRSTMTWIAYTPIPFIQIASFFLPYSNVQMIIQNGGTLSLAYGIALLLFLSVLFTAISVITFKKRDIVN